MNADVVVVGGGFAGLSAAVRLARAGRRVAVVEAAPRLGGRASTFTDHETRERVDNGQHVLFGCYRATYEFLESIGAGDLAPVERRLAVTMAAERGAAHALACPPLPAPWHLLAGILTWDAVPIRDRLGALRLAAFIRGQVSVPRRGNLSPDLTVSEWLRAHGQSAELCRWLWTPLAFAALNQSPDVARADVFAHVLARLFGSRARDSAIALPAVPLEEMYVRPAARAIADAGGSILTGTPGRISLDHAGRIAGVRVGSRTVAAPRVIAAVPWHAFARLWDAGCPRELRETCERAERMTSSPIVTVNFWFDKPVMATRFLGLVEGPMHWAFNRRALVGDAASHISMVSSGSTELAEMSSDRVQVRAFEQLQRILPRQREARLEHAVVVKERRATFSLAPHEPPRPQTITALAGFYIAGDWVDTGLPATIESAVVSGHAAADAILTDAGRPV